MPHAATDQLYPLAWDGAEYLGEVHNICMTTQMPLHFEGLVVQDGVSGSAAWVEVSASGERE